MRAGRWLVAATAFAALAAFAPAGLAASARPAMLRPGQSMFWGASGGGSRSYSFAVKPGGWRLRVAYDHPDYRISLYGTLVDPAGKTVGYLGGWNSGEAYV